MVNIYMPATLLIPKFQLNTRYNLFNNNTEDLEILRKIFQPPVDIMSISFKAKFRIVFIGFSVSIVYSFSNEKWPYDTHTHRAPKPYTVTN